MYSYLFDPPVLNIQLSFVQVGPSVLSAILPNILKNQFHGVPNRPIKKNHSEEKKTLRR